MNAYTAVLQRQLDKERPHRDVIVNSVHPGTYHSKMTMDRSEAVSRDNAADTVAYLSVGTCAIMIITILILLS